MPYLPLDLDAKRKLEGIERGLGLPRHAMVGGAMDLYESVWRAKGEGKPAEVASVVDGLTLDAAFGPDPRIREAMVAREFLEPVEQGWRVRGAAKWLFGMEGKSRGGKAASGNLNRGNQPGKSRVPAGRPTPPSPAQPGPLPEDTSRLIPGSNTQHPNNPASQHPLSFSGSAVADPVAAMGGLPGLEHLATAGRRVEDKPTRNKGEKTPDPRHHPLKLRLVAVFAELRQGAKYDFTSRDAKDLTKLLGKGPDDEVEARWRRGLMGAFRRECHTLADLVARWNSLATEDTGPPGKVVDIRKSPVRAEDVPRESFAQVGRDNGF